MAIQPHEVRRLEEFVLTQMASESAKPHETAKRNVELLVFGLVKLIQQDRDRVLAQIQEERAQFIKECREGIRPKYSFVPSVQETFSKRLWDSWDDVVKRIPPGVPARIEVFEGFCYLARTQWFQVITEPEAVMEPTWDYIIDPLPSGVLHFGADGRVANTGTLVVAPQSSWQRAYAGMPEALVRQQESEDA